MKKFLHSLCSGRGNNYLQRIVAMMLVVVLVVTSSGVIEPKSVLAAGTSHVEGPIASGTPKSILERDYYQTILDIKAEL